MFTTKVAGEDLFGGIYCERSEQQAFVRLLSPTSSFHRHSCNSTTHFIGRYPHKISPSVLTASDMTNANSKPLLTAIRDLPYQWSGRHRQTRLQKHHLPGL